MMRDDRWWWWDVVEPDAEYMRTSKRNRPGRSPLRRDESVAVDDLARSLFQRWRWS